VTGRVLLDGQPLKEGQITFHPNGIAGTVAGGDIRDGAYRLTAREGPVIGSNRIEVRSVQKTGRTVPATVIPEGDAVMTEGQLVEEYLEIVPARYNRNSELIYEITPGRNEINLELIADPSGQGEAKS
jgi:hypothetical protein